MKNLFHMKLRAGFTLIEIIIVTAIITLMVALIFIQLESTRQRSRDTRREANIKTMQNSLELYFLAQRRYPGPDTFTTLNCSPPDSVNNDLINTGFISGPLCDPLNNATYNYQYRAIDTSGSSFEIRYSLESNTIIGKNAGLQPLVTP